MVLFSSSNWCIKSEQKRVIKRKTQRDRDRERVKEPLTTKERDR